MGKVLLKFSRTVFWLQGEFSRNLLACVYSKSRMLRWKLRSSEMASTGHFTVMGFLIGLRTLFGDLFLKVTIQHTAFLFVKCVGM